MAIGTKNGGVFWSEDQSPPKQPLRDLWLNESTGDRIEWDSLSSKDKAKLHFLVGIRLRNHGKRRQASHIFALESRQGIGIVSTSGQWTTQKAIPRRLRFHLFTWNPMAGYWTCRQAVLPRNRPKPRLIPQSYGNGHWNCGGMPA